MSLRQDMTYISLSGTKENIMRLLNSAIRKIKGKDLITDSDSCDDMFIKIIQEGKGRLKISISDLVDDESMNDPILQEKSIAWSEKINKLKAIAEGNHTFISEEEKNELVSFQENFTDERMILIENVSEDGAVYTVDFELFECEGCPYYRDWVDWDDISRIYKCKVVIDCDGFPDVNADYLGTTIYEPDGESTKKKFYQPKLDLSGFIDDFEKLKRLDLERYRSRKVRDMKIMIGLLQDEINKENLMEALEELESAEGHLVIPEGVTELSGTMMPYIKQMKSIYIPSSVSAINNYIISASSLESIKISPDNPYFYSDGNCIMNKVSKREVLMGCNGAVIPAYVEKIGPGAFSGCEGLDEIIIPANIRMIEKNAFSYCINLSSVNIENGVESIGFCAFHGCRSLSQIVIPDSVSRIYPNAFDGCSSLVSVTLPQTLCDIPINVFQNTPFGDSAKQEESSDLAVQFAEDKRLVTVGQLKNALAEYGKANSKDDVVCYIPEGEAFYINFLSVDNCGNICIHLAEKRYNDGYYNVSMLSAELENLNSDLKVYLNFGETYLTFGVYENNRILSYDDENFAVICDCAELYYYVDDDDSDF